MYSILCYCSKGLLVVVFVRCCPGGSKAKSESILNEFKQLDSPDFKILYTKRVQK